MLTWVILRDQAVVVVVVKVVVVVVVVVVEVVVVVVLVAAAVAVAIVAAVVVAAAVAVSATVLWHQPKYEILVEAQLNDPPNSHQFQLHITHNIYHHTYISYLFNQYINRAYMCICAPISLPTGYYIQNSQPYRYIDVQCMHYCKYRFIDNVCLLRDYKYNTSSHKMWLSRVYLIHEHGVNINGQMHSFPLED